MDNFEEIIKRVNTALEIKNQKQLAAVLGITPPGITDAKTRNNFPSDWVVKISTGYGINPAWLLTGQGPMKITTGEASESKPEINAAEGMLIAKRVLESGTDYATALWHNLKSFDEAVKGEAKVKELERKIDLLLDKVDALERAVVLPEEPAKKREANG